MAELDKYGLSLPARKGEKKESVNAVVVLSKLWYVGLEVTTPNLSLDKDLCGLGNSPSLGLPPNLGLMLRIGFY